MIISNSKRGKQLVLSKPPSFSKKCILSKKLFSSKLYTNRFIRRYLLSKYCMSIAKRVIVRDRVRLITMCRKKGRKSLWRWLKEVITKKKLP